MKKANIFTILILSLLLVLISSTKNYAQSTGDDNIIQGTITSTTDGETLIGASVTEIDGNNRVISSANTDINGHYVLRVKNLNGRISVAYIGFDKQIIKISNKKTIDVQLTEKDNTMKTVEVVAQKRQTQGGFSIPEREVSTAIQTIETKEFEGLQVSSIDEALQGRIAGLDIVANSSDPGTGTSMRIRGVTSITGNSQPLIVVNGVPYDIEVDPNFDFANSNQEQYANMLSINPDDILEISVLKDAGAAAIWGSKGANGVLMITTKRGLSGPTKIDYSYRYTRTVQPHGLNMLNGDNFTMLMKEAYFNPRQDKNASNIPEYNYDKNNPEYENFNNNTNWVDEVTQVGNINDHYVTISGGGERANYRVSGGYLGQNGTIIGQKYSRISSRANLDYRVSDRIRFGAEFSLTNSDNDRSYSNILAIAYQKMPNVSIYAQDKEGNNTGIFYNISRNSMLNADQKYLENPVALALLAKNKEKAFRITPTFRLTYDILNPDKQMLRFNSFISFDINNNKTSRFLPQEVSNAYWSDTNRGEDGESESVAIFMDNNLVWQPKFENKDHNLMLYGSFQVNTGNSAWQDIVSYTLPSNYAPDASNVAFLSGGGSAHSTWRSLAYLFRGHYAYKSRYIADFTYRIDGSTKFGKDNKYGQFPGVSLKYIMSDEPFFKENTPWLTMFAIRPAWGISGNQPRYEYLHYSRYQNYGTYIDMNAVKPSTLQLSNLKWETTNSFNLGFDVSFWDKYIFDINLYKKNTKDLLFPNVAISQISGFSSLSYINGGSMDNSGWEVNFYANNIVKTKDFGIDFSFNLSNYTNLLINLNQSLLDSYNGDFNYSNGSYLTRVQTGNSFGSIYGFRYKGVYQYDKYVSGTQENAPVAKDINGKVILDQNNEPKYMYFAYGKTMQYRFRGGDAIYEDVNHDGSIDELDIVYLGNANPKLNGGFGPTFRYKNFYMKMFFNFRYGNKIINMARMNAENMYSDDNQSVAVDWRWRVDGDVTNMPRALYREGYNWLGSDRYVENGSFLRFKYLTFNYAFPKEIIKPYKLEKVNLYLTFNNLFVFTKYTGVDPEVGYGTLTSNRGLSIDGSSTPRTRDFTFGLTIGL
ncbi:MAG: SusC/RagA family TonB-linked outer membrane protein [Paludibacteraceae bacterium]